MQYSRSSRGVQICRIHFKFVDEMKGRVVGLRRNVVVAFDGDDKSKKVGHYHWVFDNPARVIKPDTRVTRESIDVFVEKK